jgi:HAD superfamily phosphatase (TIGR01668 family)
MPSLPNSNAVAIMRLLRPDFIVDSVTEFDGQRLAKLGVRGLLLDVDGALKPHYGTEILPEIVRWIQQLREQAYRIAFLSNGRGVRIGPLAQSVGVPVFSDARKPLPFRCRRALAELGLAPRETLLMGDQLFTDVLCGRLVGTQTAYVHPLSREEPIYTSIKRPFERFLLGRARKASSLRLETRSSSR